jgi:hypothetical protein
MKQSLLLLTIVTCLFAGCKKDEDKASSAKTIVKYELILPAPKIVDTTILALFQERPYIKYIDGNGILVEESDTKSFTVWSKEIEVTKRPFLGQLFARGYVNIREGKARINVYVDGKLNTTQELQLVTSGWDEYGMYNIYNIIPVSIP